MLVEYGYTWIIKTNIKAKTVNSTEKLWWFQISLFFSQLVGQGFI